MISSCARIEDYEIRVPSDAVESIACDLQALSDQIWFYRTQAAKHVPQKHWGDMYERAVESFVVENVQSLDRRYDPTLRAYAHEICCLRGRGWEDDPRIVGLWMDVAKAKEGSSSHHPTKTVATIILSPNNRMLAMAANGIPAGLSIHGDCFLNSLRKYSTSCSEPNAMAEILGIKAEIPKKYKGSKSHFDLVRAAVQKRRRALYKKDQPNRNLLEGSTFIVTALSCTLCAPLLVEYKIGTLIYDVTGGIHFTRKDKNDEALAILRCGGVTVRGFNSTTCSFVPT